MDHPKPNTSITNTANSTYVQDFSFKHCGYSFKVVNSKSMHDLFYDLVDRSLHEVLRLSRNSSEYKLIMQQSIDLDNRFEDNIIRIMVFDQNDAIATICAYLDTKMVQPTELKESISFDNLRNHCNILELGRLTILEPYRHKPGIGLGLFKFVFEVALTYNVDLLIESAFKDKIEMFKRIGLEGFNIKESYDRIYQLPKTLLFFNFAANLFAYCNRESTDKGQPLCNYPAKLFSICRPEFLNRGYQSLLARNKTRHLAEKTYLMKFNNLL